MDGLLRYVEAFIPAIEFETAFSQNPYAQTPKWCLRAIDGKESKSTLHSTYARKMLTMRLEDLFGANDSEDQLD
jgi:hypothetical protein